MASAENRKLTLITIDNNVTVDVTYDAVFTPLERNLAAAGMKFVETIRVIGVDPPGGTTGSRIHTFPSYVFPFPKLHEVATQPVTIERHVKVTKPRSVFQEDQDLGDDDEIRCRIDITPVGMPQRVVAFTDEKILVG